MADMKYPYMFRRKTSQNWCIKVPVPNDLQPAFGGKKQIWRSLRTSDRRQAEIVFSKFEEILGKDIPTVNASMRDTLTVFTYRLGSEVPPGEHRKIEEVRQICFTLEEFSNRFISGANLPSGDELDSAVRRVLGIT